MAVLQTASSMWWIVGWLASIAMLAIGYFIGISYYDIEADGNRDVKGGDLQ